MDVGGCFGFLQKFQTDLVKKPETGIQAGTGAGNFAPFSFYMITTGAHWAASNEFREKREKRKIAKIKIALPDY